jgi:hypothetical protein
MTTTSLLALFSAMLLLAIVFYVGFFPAFINVPEVSNTDVALNIFLAYITLCTAVLCLGTDEHLCPFSLNTIILTLITTKGI